MLFGHPGTAGLPSREMWRSEVSRKEGDRGCGGFPCPHNLHAQFRPVHWWFREGESRLRQDKPRYPKAESA